MRTLFLTIFLATLGCSQPEWPQPDSQSGQLVVHLSAKARKGTLKPEGSNGEYTANLGPAWKFKKVNYRRLPDIVVFLEGSDLRGGALLSASSTLTAESRHFDHKLVLLPQGGELEFVNDRREPLNLFVFSEKESFEVSLPSKQVNKISLNQPGSYEVSCDEDEKLMAEVLVLGHRWGQRTQAGDSLFLDKIPPGSYTLVVKAPRLPEKRLSVEITAGQRRELEVQMGVGGLGSP